MRIKAVLLMLLMDEAGYELARFVNKRHMIEEIDRKVERLYELKILLEMELGQETPENVIHLWDKKKR